MALTYQTLFKCLIRCLKMITVHHDPIVIHTPILVKDGKQTRVENPICEEIPLEIRINGEPYVTLMRTPGAERELAIGFCFTDELITSVADVTGMTCYAEDDAPFIQRVELTLPSFRGKQGKRGSVIKSSSGSINRAQMLEDILRNIAPIRSQQCFDLAIFDSFPEKFDASQTLRAKCGATHGAALFDQRGNVLFGAEDIGRHNGLDKLIGHILLNNISTDDKLLMLSSRASFEMMQKAARIAIPVVASVSAPTNLALRVAERLNCTYISFLKKHGFYIYTHPWRFGIS